MADNKTHSWSGTFTGSKSGNDDQWHTSPYSFTAINNSAASVIPPYSQINSATITATGKKDPKASSTLVTCRMAIWLANGNSCVVELISKNQGDGVYFTGTETLSASITNYIKSKTPNAGYIECSGASNICVYLYFIYAFKQNFTSTASITWNYNEPRAIVSVSKSGEGTVTGAGTYHYGNSYTITATPATGWKFVKWSDGNTNASRTFTVNNSLITAYETSKSYQAVFEKLKYTVTWKNHDGTTLETDTNVEYGTTPSYNGATPTKASTAQHAYTFSGWSPSVSAVTGNVTYTAQFTATVRKYTVKWYNYDGTLLETDTDVPYGTKPTYNGATPTKPSDDYYNYGFAGWSPSTSEAIQGDKNFTAQFAQTDRYYTVRWVNASAVQGVEGELLETDTVKFNTQPDYNGATPKHPKQDTDPALNYNFIGWSAKVTDPAKPDTELETVKGNITYTAIYETTPKLYPIRFILFDTDDTVILEYGTEITIEAPEVTGYQFVKWSDGNTDNPRTVTVTGEATYQAIYEVSKHTLKLSYRETDGKITGAENGTYEYGTSFTLTAQPNSGYRFLYWAVISDDIETTNYDNPLQFNIYGNTTIGAVFEKIPIPIKVNLEQVTGVYIVPTTKTIVYVINGTVPTVEIKADTVDEWNFLVSNSIPENSYPLEKLFITDKNGVTTQIY